MNILLRNQMRSLEQKTERHNLAMEAKLDRALAAIGSLASRAAAGATGAGAESSRRSGGRTGV
jgi:hypothetical protein